ncbi:MAG: pilin [Candidatus Microgenomates bacterium]
MKKTLIVVFLISLFSSLILFFPKKTLAQDCGEIGQACCSPGFLCNKGSICDIANHTYSCIKSNLSTTCGTEGLPCCAGSKSCDTNNLTCDPFYTCVSATSTPFPSDCGEFQQACCSPDFTCDENNGLTCDIANHTYSCIKTTNNSSILTTCGIQTAIGCIPISDSGSLLSFILKWAIGIGGGIAFLLMLYAGFMIMTASGDPERLKAGQELLTSAIAGLILLIFSIFILKFIGIDILGLGSFGFP